MRSAGSVQLQQPLLGVPARRRTRAISTYGARLQPRLHARADPPKYAEVLLNIARPSEHWTAEKIGRWRLRARPPAAARVDLGAPDLSDRLRRQQRQARNAPRHLRPRRPHHRRHQSERGHLEQAPERKREEIAAARASRRPRPPGPARSRSRPTPRRATPGGCRRRSSAKRQRSKPAVDPRLAPEVCFARRVSRKRWTIGHRSPLPTAVRTGIGRGVELHEHPHRPGGWTSCNWPGRTTGFRGVRSVSLAGSKSGNAGGPRSRIKPQTPALVRWLRRNPAGRLS